MTPPVLAPTTIYANLDREARWTGVVLPAAVQRKLSAAAIVLAALPDATIDAAIDATIDATADATIDATIDLGDGRDELAPMPARDVWAPAAVDPTRARRVDGWMPPTMHVGAPPARDRDVLAWAADSDVARAANDRRLAHRVATAGGFALAAAAIIESVEALVDHLARFADGERWVCKSVMTAAGRDRWHGRGPTIEAEARTRIGRLIARAGAVVVEPWLDRVADVGTCGMVAAAAAGSGVALAPPHRLRCDARGGFVGIELAAPELAEADRAQLALAALAAGTALAALGYAGPFAVDAFTYRDARDGAVRLHPLCEINARYTFGWVARGLARRLGIRALGFDAPPPGARVLVAPTADDPTTAWVR